ncbi:MAG TPA: DUF2461 domain-containing protein [Roseiflexaceae bacterium]|nr:DUF2461 domain-containing protein [Roseiflexaceae bacterium]
MPNSLDLKPILLYLTELSQHNAKPWFDAHRSAYESARGIFEQCITRIIDQFRESDQLDDLTANACIARIFRDIRFSADKSPYKTNFAAVVGPGGWKGTSLGYYIALEPHGRSMVAGGLYRPAPAQLDRFRQAIDTNAAAFTQIMAAPAFVDAFGTIEGERLKSAPKGYDRAHPDIALLQLKQITVVHRFSDQEVAGRDFERQVVSHCRAMKPFLAYLEEITQ